VLLAGRSGLVAELRDDSGSSRRLSVGDGVDAHVVAPVGEPSSRRIATSRRLPACGER
jgi:hypothetical protein